MSKRFYVNPESPDRWRYYRLALELLIGYGLAGLGIVMLSR